MWALRPPAPARAEVSGEGRWGSRRAECRGQGGGSGGGLHREQSHLPLRVPTPALAPAVVTSPSWPGQSLMGWMGEKFGICLCFVGAEAGGLLSSEPEGRRDTGREGTAEDPTPSGQDRAHSLSASFSQSTSHPGVVFVEQESFHDALPPSWVLGWPSLLPPPLPWAAWGRLACALPSPHLPAKSRALVPSVTTPLGCQQHRQCPGTIRSQFGK